MEDRFWAKVDRRAPDECWPWTGVVTGFGYGFMLRDDEGGKWYLAHRLSYELHVGPITDDLCILHHCDNPPCVNPAHLYAGTRADNARDRARRHRGAPQAGGGNHHALLTEADVYEIVRLVEEEHMSQLAVAEQYGIKQPQVSRIVRRVAWSHLWEE